jgi:Leucine-rich repeat (LRR) protein
VPDLSAFALHTLYLQNNQLTEISALRGLSTLEVLWLDSNEQLGSKAINIGKPFHEDRAAVQALIGKK